MSQGIFFTTIQGLSAAKSLKGITISKDAVENGIFKRLRGLLLPCYLYLAILSDDHRKGQFIISDALKNIGCTRKELLKSLIELEKEGLIELIDLDPTREKHPILFSLKKDHLFQEKDFITNLLTKEFCSEEEVVEALVALYRLPHGEEVNERLREQVENYFKVFDKQVLIEVLRRSFDWGEKNKEGKPFSYLQSILEDLKESGVVNYQDLQERDRIYYQTRELAKACGIKIHELNQNPTQKRILENWITKRDEKDFALKLDIALLAVEEATRKSRSRHPSLDYIERNFILPWKEARIENIQQAREFLQSVPEKISTPSGEKEKSLHDQFAIWAQ